MATSYMYIFGLITLLFITAHSNYCKSASNFYFNHHLPTKRSLPFCKEYNKNTCCSPVDSHKIFQSIKSILKNDNVSEICKQITMDISCSSCNPDIGTHHINGICTNYCDKWYKYCQNEYYYMDIYGQLKPCQEDSTVCSPLNTFINNGKSMCEASGFDTNHIFINCFNGHARNK
eukprot:161640_1